MRKFSILFLTLLLGASAASAQGIANLHIAGNEVTASLDLVGISADLSLSFEQSVGLTASNLGLSAQLVDLHDLALALRLPSGGLGGALGALPGLFPVLVRVRPPAAGGLSFSGLYTLGLHVYNLEFTANCPLRLFSAADGGPFQDITASMGTGSYRVRGSKGSFSEFLILADLRPLGTVINQKFDGVFALLSASGGAIPAPLFDDLNRQIQNARALHRAGDEVGAARAVDGFAATVQSHSGSDIPDVWRASGDLQNVAGQLRAAAATLRFSLGLAPVH
jgi:hypothetical protein